MQPPATLMSCNPDRSSLTDTQVLGELGWTLQVIYDMSGGIVPAFWRPPYGDVDNRMAVRLLFW